MTSLRYVVVGGVGGGMAAAARLRRLDETAEIIVLEQTGEVSLATCGMPYYVSGEITNVAALSVQTPESLRAALNLDVRLYHRVTGLDAAAKIVHAVTPTGEVDIAYDQLILSPGAVPAPLPVAGIDGSRIHTLRTLDDAVALANLAADGTGRALVMGAGFIGLEAAEALAHRGLSVILVEAVDHVMPPLEPELAWWLDKELRRLGMDVRVNTRVERLDDGPDGVAVTRSDGTALTVDFVVRSTGVVPATTPFAASGVACDPRGAILVDEYGRTNLPGVWAIGDAVASRDAVTGASRPVPLSGPASRAGRLVADAIVRPASARPRPTLLGTAIARVGDLTVALTGANRASLAAADQPYATIHLHPMHHAGYFPGAEQLHLLVHYEPTTMRLLGAQCVGRAGVDRRIDVLATAIRAGLTGPDLIDLDLTYSPPYGASKDPVNLVGYALDNIATGQMAVWGPEEVEWARREAYVLDVRTPTEFATGHLPEAVNIAHTSLRERLDEVRAAAAGRPIAVTCQSGVRSYLAYRMLASAGLEARTLSGGMLTLRGWLGAAADQILVTGSGQ